MVPNTVFRLHLVHWKQIFIQFLMIYSNFTLLQKKNYQKEKFLLKFQKCDFYEEKFTLIDNKHEPWRIYCWKVYEHVRHNSQQLSVPFAGR